METKSTSQGRKMVRVVARVKPSTDPVKQASSSKSISVDKPKGDESESVSISFGAQFAGSKDSYKVDYCYEENEATSLILAKEIKPLISSVFEGKDANVIAHGARCSGKTHLIQGSEKEPGIAVLTMAEMLSMAEERGDSISVSIYEVSNETVYDIAHQEKRVVSVLEGAQGKIQLKGLSQVPVKSLSEFQNLYFGLKKFQKLTSDPPLRSHKGVMIYVNSGDVNSGSLGRMNFLDMAGYEDARKQGNGLAPLEISKINKSIYALQNVLYALSANESHVPYRESKLTRMLKDCLQGCNRTLMITCLPREFSQDSFCMLNLASRICLGSNRVVTNPTKKRTSTLTSSSSVSSVAQRRQTPLAVPASSKKLTGAQGNVTERKTKINTPAFAIKGRKLFSEANDPVKSKNNTKKIEDKAKMGVKKMEGKAKMGVKKMEVKTKTTVKKEISTSRVVSTSKVVLNVQGSSSKEEVCSSSIVTDSQSSLVEEETSVSTFSSPTVAMEPGYSTSLHGTPQKDEKTFSQTTHCDDATVGKGHSVERDINNLAIVEDLNMVNEGENLDKENIETSSPPLSPRFQELSNNSVQRDNNSLAIVKDLNMVNEGENLDKENIEITSPPLSLQLLELSNKLKSICKNSSVHEKFKLPVEEVSECNEVTDEAVVNLEKVLEYSEVTADPVVNVELKTPEKMPPNIACSPWKSFSAHSSKLKKSAVGEYLKFLNTAEKDDLKKLKGIGEKRATYIVELREESPEPFKSLDDLKDIGLSEKQIKGLLRKEIGDIFH